MVNTGILARRFWIFDLDGTLTQPQHDFKAIKRALGIPEDADILHHLGQLSAHLADKKHEQLDRIEIELARQAQPAAGVKELIATLAEAGVAMGVLTRNSKINAHIALEAIGLNDYFERRHILGRHEVEPKPSPQGVTRLLEDWRVSAAQALLVGDYLYDLQSARAAGSAAVHVDSSALFPWPEFTDLGVRDLAELRQLFIAAGTI